MNDRIALIVDSGTDVPISFIEKYNIFVLPLIINYNNKSYYDGIDITSEEVYTRLSYEIPTTSLPDMQIIKNVFEKIKSDGYNKIIAVTISSKLSGTYNAIRLASEEFSDIKTYILDTKNIGIGAGMSAIAAAEMIEKNFSYNKIIDKLEEIAIDTKVFFCLNTLEYLKKGGRIGHVKGTIGSLLDIKPIISCNTDGIYYSIHNCIGRKQSINKTITYAKKFADKCGKYNIAIAHGSAEAELQKIEIQIKNTFNNINKFLKGSVSPALGIHTGPGLIGVAVQKAIF